VSLTHASFYSRLSINVYCYSIHRRLRAFTNSAAKTRELNNSMKFRFKDVSNEHGGQVTLETRNSKPASYPMNMMILERLRDVEHEHPFNEVVDSY
jgi:hypothetical protein